MAGIKYRYWDSDTFLAHLQGDPIKAPQCLGVMQAVESGEVKIVTSAFTLSEVAYIKGPGNLTREQSDKILDFFQNEFIVVITLDRKIAEIGRDLVTQNNVKPPDAVHLASALHVNNTIYPIESFDTFDQGLIRLSQKIGDPQITISVPNLPYQEMII